MTKRTRTTAYLDATDIGAMQRVQERWGIDSEAAIVRLALHVLATMDPPASLSKERLYAFIASEGDTKLATLRFDTNDRAAIAHVRQVWELGTTSDAIRLAVRVLAQAERLEMVLPDSLVKILVEEVVNHE